MPYHIAFNYKSLSWCIIYYLIDTCFLIDLSLQFFTTIPETDRLVEVTDRKKIAKNYLSGWFIVDFCSILPFDIIMSLIGQGTIKFCDTSTDADSGGSSQANIMLRAPKITKAFRAIRLLRMVKVFKLMKN